MEESRGERGSPLRDTIVPDVLGRNGKNFPVTLNMVSSCSECNVDVETFDDHTISSLLPCVVHVELLGVSEFCTERRKGG